MNQKRKKKSHLDWKQWTTWIVVGLMLVGMVIYVISDNESEDIGDPLKPLNTQPTDQFSPENMPMPAAE